MASSRRWARHPGALRPERALPHEGGKAHDGPPLLGRSPARRSGPRLCLPASRAERARDGALAPGRARRCPALGPDPRSPVAADHSHRDAQACALGAARVRDGRKPRASGGAPRGARRQGGGARDARRGRSAGGARAGKGRGCRRHRPGPPGRGRPGPCARHPCGAGPLGGAARPGRGTARPRRGPARRCAGTARAGGGAAPPSHAAGAVPGHGDPRSGRGGAHGGPSRPRSRCRLRWWARSSPCTPSGSP